jgi:hypothetical protein
MDSLEVLATDMVSSSYEEEGLDISVELASELLKRAAAGVRKWPTSPSPDGSVGDSFEANLTTEINSALGLADSSPAVEPSGKLEPGPPFDSEDGHIESGGAKKQVS